MANITVSPDVDTFLKKQNKGEMSDFLDSSAKLLVELTANSRFNSPPVVVEVTNGDKTGIKTKWTPSLVSGGDPDGLWDEANSIFTAPSNGLYAFHLDRIIVDVKGRAPMAAGSSTSGSAWNPCPRGIGLLVNGVPYLLEDLTGTSVSGPNQYSNVGSFISNANNGYNTGHGADSTSTLIIELAEDDEVSLATVLKQGGFTGHHSNIYIHFQYDKVHNGPSGRPIQIYKL